MLFVHRQLAYVPCIECILLYCILMGNNKGTDRKGNLCLTIYSSKVTIFLKGHVFVWL